MDSSAICGVVMDTHGGSSSSRRVSLLIHVGGRFEGDVDGKQYVGGELLSWTMDVAEMTEVDHLCFLGSLKFVNIKRLSFLIPGKTVADGLLELPIGQDKPYLAMATILSNHGNGHIYVEYTAEEFSWEGATHPNQLDICSNSEEEEVIEVECLFDNDDEEVVVACEKKKSYIAGKGKLRIYGFEVEMELVLDNEFSNVRRAKKKPVGEGRKCWCDRKCGRGWLLKR